MKEEQPYITTKNEGWSVEEPTMQLRWRELNDNEFSSEKGLIQYAIVSRPYSSHAYILEQKFRVICVNEVQYEWRAVEIEKSEVNQKADLIISELLDEKSNLSSLIKNRIL